MMSRSRGRGPHRAPPARSRPVCGGRHQALMRVSHLLGPARWVGGVGGWGERGCGCTRVVQAVPSLDLASRSEQLSTCTRAQHTGARTHKESHPPTPACFSICLQWYSSCRGGRSVRPSTAAFKKAGCSVTYMGAVSYSSDTRDTCDRARQQTHRDAPAATTTLSTGEACLLLCPSSPQCCGLPGLRGR